ncbi:MULTISPECIES: diguanylate cyclase regulator RdcB family protein [Acinetobacter]|uniref:Diguanylate cyclase regulator RdcB family protein n=1 Tax=Acinetobacter corruptisaponis TaxID=3045147 RepID=A0ABY8S830_9GAMM|nr:diguanylate cyclase regulator RdcB family protein [Acinetobacter sp. KCTC 92772]WHP07506.1 diguanylate cyclase regulator RdcB family protein [Acinetobacter sp. KCTC 92772]
MKFEVSETMPCMADKFVIEIANSIQVSKDHINVQSQRLDKVSRLVDGFTGTGAKRQYQINQNLSEGVESAFEWLNVLTQEHRLGFEAIHIANQKITEVQDAVTDLANFSVETRDLLAQLSKDLHDRCDHLDQRLSLIEAESKAERQIDLLFKKWEVSHDFEQLSPLLKFYTVLERLYWGDFGDYVRKYKEEPKARRALQDLRDHICLTAIQSLQDDKGIGKRDFLHPLQWAEHDDEYSLDFNESYAYMGDWTRVNKMPLNYFASQQPEQLSPALPRILTARTLVLQSFDEMFEAR